MRILILDNYDSFTYNLFHLIETITSAPITVIRNDNITLQEVELYDKIVLSPGPGLPKDAGIMPELLQTFHATKSIFGVCLGMQAIAEHYGGSLKNLQKVCHGQAMRVTTNTEGLFKDCPKHFLVGRYHSWVVDEQTLPQQLNITATDDIGNIMALNHTTDQVCGVQFHPESVLSQYGQLIFKNWLNQ